MLGRRVYGADNREWRVARRWLPWKPRVRGPFRDAVHASDGFDVGFGLADGPSGIVVAIGATIAFVLFVVFLLPLLLTALEIVVVLALLPVFVVARLVLRKPWIIVARTKGPPPEERTASASGWRGSTEVMEELIQDIRSHG